MLSKSKTPKKVTFDEPVALAKKTGEEIAKILSASKPVTSQNKTNDTTRDKSTTWSHFER